MGNSYFIGLRLLNNWNVQSFSMNYRNLAHRRLFSRVRQIYCKNSMNLNKKTQFFSAKIFLKLRRSTSYEVTTCQSKTIHFIQTRVQCLLVHCLRMKHLEK